MTSFCPGRRIGTKQVSSQISNTVRLQAPSIVKGALQLLVAERRNHIHPSTACPRFQVVEPFTFGAIAITILVTMIHPGFIGIDQIERTYGRQLGHKRGAFQRIAFAIPISLFFRVKPIFCNARLIVRLLISPSHKAASSGWVRSG